MRDADVGEVEVLLGEFGTSKDEALMSVRRDDTFGVSLGKEAVFSALDRVPETPIDGACKRLASVS